MPALPKQKCPVCGKSFQPKSKRAIYDSRACRIRAHRQKKERAEKLKVMNGRLELLRQRLPDTAKIVEDITLKFGTEAGQMALDAVYHATSELRDRYIKTPKVVM